MKKVISLMIAMLLCVGMAVPAFAADVEFIPSPYPYETPTIVEGTDSDGNGYIGIIYDENGNIMEYVPHGCLRITPIAHIWDSTKEVPEDVRDILKYLYSELKSGRMVLPFEKFEGLSESDMKIRDLCDLRWGCEEHPIMLAPIGVVIELTFTLGVNPEDEVYVMGYYEDSEEWEPVVKTVNNGDGTVTCTLEELTPLVFTIKVAPQEAPAAIGEVVDTTPESGSNVVIWVVVLLVLAVAVVLVMKNKKKATATK